LQKYINLEVKIWQWG